MAFSIHVCFKNPETLERGLELGKMKVEVTDKYFWFIFVELLCGFAASICWMQQYGIALRSLSGTVQMKDQAMSRGDGESYNVIHGILISGGFFPVVFRSMLYTYGKDMGKATFMTLMIMALCFYIIGGVFWLIDEGSAIRGVFAIACGAILIVDLVLKLLGK